MNFRIFLHPNADLIMTMGFIWVKMLIIFNMSVFADSTIDKAWQLRIEVVRGVYCHF